MRKFITIVAAVLALVPPAAAPVLASDSTDVMATVKQYDDAFNRHDMKAWNALCTDQAAIIDDFAPHVWQGAGACGDWWNAFDASSKQNAFSDAIVTLEQPWHVAVTGDRAYVVEPTTFTFKAKGKPASERGVWTLALQKLPAGWRITGWGWAQR